MKSATTPPNDAQLGILCKVPISSWLDLSKTFLREIHFYSNWAYHTVLSIDKITAPMMYISSLDPCQRAENKIVVVLDEPRGIPFLTEIKILFSKICYDWFEFTHEIVFCQSCDFGNWLSKSAVCSTAWKKVFQAKDLFFIPHGWWFICVMDGPSALTSQHIAKNCNGQRDLGHDMFF